MKKYTTFLSAVLAVGLLASGCGKTDAGNSTEKETAQKEESATKEITYLGKTYEVPAEPKRIFVSTVEPIEEMTLLGVKPYAVADGIYLDDPPEEVQKTLTDVEWIDGGYEPDKEQLLKLQPDLILATARMEPADLKAFEKIAPTIPVSVGGNDSAETIRTIGAIVGKEAEAEAAVKAYEEKAAESRKKVEEAGLADKKVMYLRISSEWGISGYDETITYNQTLYDGLGFQVPDVIKDIDRRDEIPLEKLAQENPDYLFVLTPVDDLKAIDDLAKKPLWNEITAVKEDHVFVNPVHPDLFGVPYLSKQLFLEKATADLLK
ncbi:ABC transporter substrate-binding protein [Sporosarcina koreensis]|uniref:ABC transporter substrate-binding protein n=1 Tax=Sporosarcina koreensis TaxID=334735 RepID=UPI00058CF184|nr:ABC transporter substrate-binding protein [Sporosarcina koreensis]